VENKVLLLRENKYNMGPAMSNKTTPADLSNRALAIIAAGIQLTLVGIWWSVGSAYPSSLFGDGLVLLGTVLVAQQVATPVYASIMADRA